MTPAAFGLVLVAAMLHAGWNFVVKDSSDRLVAIWAVVAGATAVNLVVLAVAGLPDRKVWGWIGVSAVIHVGYNLALVAAYDRTDFSVAYPIARGIAPVIVTVAGVALLGDVVAPIGIVGVLLVTASLAVVAYGVTRNGVGWALATGAFIAGYTVVDGAGVRAGDESLRYLAALFAVQFVPLTLVVVKRRGTATIRQRLFAHPWRLLGAGVGSAGAYLLVLIAARTAPLGLVSGLRETSTAFGVLLAVLFLDEHVSRKHWLAVGLAAFGAAAIAFA